MKARLSPRRLIAAGALLLFAVGAVLWLTPSDEYIFLPDPARPVASFVDVEGEKPDRNGGGIYFVDVIVRKATLLERLFPSVRDGSTLVPAEAVRPPNLSDRERRRADRLDMTRSQEVAAAVALRELGYDVPVRATGAIVTAVFEDAPATGKLRAGDLIVAVDGESVRSLADLRRLLRARKPGDTVRLGVRDGAKTRTVTLKTARHPRLGIPVIGVLVDQGAEIDLPISVQIDIGNVGGPSAGLAFALDVMEELGGNVDHGYKIAATGQIEIDGRVVAIGGVKQKTLGAREAGVDVLLVPAGDNAKEARRYSDGLRVIAVNSFQQALRALATLPGRT